MYMTDFIYNYLQTRYEATEADWSARRAIWNFKDGHMSESLYQAILSKIRGIIPSSHQDWVIAFIPASTGERTRMRFGRLAERLSGEYNVQLAAVYNAEDRASTMTTGKIADPTTTFGIHDNLIKGKKVLLFDDVTTTGRSFTRTADKLMSHGAAGVHGLFIGKTVHPDYY